MSIHIQFGFSLRKPFFTGWRHFTGFIPIFANHGGRLGKSMIFFRKERPRQSDCVWVTADAAAIICSHHRRRFCGSSPRVIIFLEPPRCLTQRWWGIHLNYKIIQPFTAAGERDRPLRRFSLSRSAPAGECAESKDVRSVRCVYASLVHRLGRHARMEKSSSLAKSKHLSQVDSLIIFCPTDLEKNEFSPRAAPVSARAKSTRSLARSRLLLHF